MFRDIRSKLVAIAALVAMALYFLAPQSPGSGSPIKLGIDLAGGAELRYEVLFPPGFDGDRRQVVQDTIDVIRHRLGAQHLKDPVITSHGDRQITIQLAGVDADGLRDARRLIETLGKLEFYATAGPTVEELHRRNNISPEGYKVLTGRDHNPLLVRMEPVIEGRHIAHAEPKEVVQPGGLQWVTAFELDAEGSRRFDEAAESLYRQVPRGRIVIVVDGVVKSAPVVDSPSFRGHGQILGAKDRKEAQELSIILRSGSLPAPLGSVSEGPGKPESETLVGATLGADAIQRGLLASGLTMLAVALFMIVYYRTLGVVSVVATALNLLFLLALLALFQATLTLPGIAGIVLTVGMAVDANILIYERIREEQERGRSPLQAVDSGHARAFSTILDTHLTTLIGALVLYYFGRGPVQGFAVTLAAGVVTTLFTVLFCGRTFLRMLLTGGRREWRMMKLLTRPRIPFLKSAKTCMAGSILGTLLLTGILIARGGDTLGIDFKGGANVAFTLLRPQAIDEVRRAVQGITGPDGIPTYRDVQIQALADPAASGGLPGGTSQTFQMRTVRDDIEQIKRDLQGAFADSLSHEPFEEMSDRDVDPNPLLLDGRPEGRGWFLYVKAKGNSVAGIRERLASDAGITRLLEKDAQGKALFSLTEVPGAPEGLLKLKFAPTAKVSSDGDAHLRLRDGIKAGLGPDLSSSPFLSSARIGSAVAGELRTSTAWALAVSWSAMIAYVGFRFDSWRFGVVAVAALVHDALVVLGLTALAGMLVPTSWGLSFEMSLNTLAAVLTVIGYSINDTIVVFDRIRENLRLGKDSTFAEVIDASVNETLSRTLLTSFTVWLSALILYAFTARIGGGIADFSFPLLIGVVVGTYSSIYVAAPLLLWWYRGKRPATA